jgi:hypothetical protein
MSKRKRIFTAKTFEKWFKQGRGQGSGLAYKPWYTIHDVASRGVSHRLKSSWTTGRETHLLSNLERDWFFVFDWSPLVVDIREQFPLLPLQETQAIAAECGIEHPVVRRSKEKHPVVLTSDFCLTLTGKSGPFDQVRTVKYAKHLDNERVLEKFEVERRYWERRGIYWAVVTEQELPTSLVRNVELLHGKRELTDRLSLPPAQLYTIAQSLTDKVSQENLPLRRLTAACDAQFGLAAGTALTLVYYLLANRYWQIDMYTRINPGRKLTLLGHTLEPLNPGARRQS